MSVHEGSIVVRKINYIDIPKVYLDLIMLIYDTVKRNEIVYE